VVVISALKLRLSIYLVISAYWEKHKDSYLMLVLVLVLRGYALSLCIFLRLRRCAIVHRLSFSCAINQSAYAYATMQPS